MAKYKLEGIEVDDGKTIDIEDEDFFKNNHVVGLDRRTFDDGKTWVTYLVILRRIS